MTDSIHDDDKVSLNGLPLDSSSTGAEVKPTEASTAETKPAEAKPTEAKPVEIKPAELPVVVQNEDNGLQITDSAAPATPAAPVAPISVVAPPVPSAVKVHKSGPVLGEHNAEDKPETPQKTKENGAENGDKEDAVEKANELQVGDKRKAEDEVPAVNTSNGAAVESAKPQENTTETEKDADGESYAKKQKTEANGNVTKRGPGRPKGVAKTEKKVKIPTLGKAERKTRSQDKAT